MHYEQVYCNRFIIRLKYDDNLRYLVGRHNMGTSVWPHVVLNPLLYHLRVCRNSLILNIHVRPRTPHH